MTGDANKQSGHAWDGRLLVLVGVLLFVVVCCCVLLCDVVAGESLERVHVHIAKFCRSSSPVR